MYIHSPARFELRSQLHLLLNKWLLGFRPTKLSRLYIQGTTIVGIRLVFNYLRFFISQALPINASQENKKKIKYPYDYRRTMHIPCQCFETLKG